MKYSRNDYERFLNTEIETQVRNYEQVINTKALVLKERGDVFVGKFLKIQQNGQAVFKVRHTDNMPRRNSFWTATCFVGVMASFKNWGDNSWVELREQFQKAFCDANCIWISKSDDNDFCLVGIKGLTSDFAELLEREHPIIAFGPKDPPLKYLSNLIDIVKDESCATTKSILDYDEVRDLWNPSITNATTDLNLLLMKDFQDTNCVVVQGPPGTGKTYRMAKLAAQLLNENKSVLVTALTNQALMELAKKDDMAPFLEEGKITKASLTIDESKELTNLQPIVDNACNAASGNISLATFYISSGWAITANEPPFDYVIMDEASQALLPMIAASVKLGKKVIWIGDQYQLPPIIETNEDIINRFKWQSIVKGFETICRNFDYKSYMLNETFRMTQRGASSTGAFYKNQLRSVSEHQEVSTNIQELDHRGGPVLIPMKLKVGDKSPENAFQYIMDLVSRINDENKERNKDKNKKDKEEIEIAILAKFKDTIRKLQKKFVLDLPSGLIPENVRIETVDRVQGLTVDYCIFLIPNASIRYSLEKELFNVATSRAKNNTVIVVDESIMRENMPEEVRAYFLKAQDIATDFIDNNETEGIHLKIKGKIDLSQFETPKQKAVKSTTKQNIYIIDTNVFVDCPDIISKIDKKHQIVLSAKVIDELDKLKITLGEEGKRNVEKALRSINNAMDKPHVSMELSDSSLLPSDFNRRSPDNNILTVALKYKHENPILLTSDNGLQVKAKGLGIATISLKEFLKR